MVLTRKDYIRLANIWVHILSELDEEESTYIIHDKFVEFINIEYANFDIEKWSAYIAHNANQI
jgi:hypothetical protein|tara:strand:+ start:5994 stop:6182 length:189 start_codon:yes stop_codon:yes gene_type:complete